MTEVLVIGTGPAGVSAAWPLIEAGIKVRILDAGTEALPPVDAARPSLAALRQGAPDAWRHLLKPDLSGLRETGGSSPKLRLAADTSFESGYAEINRLEVRDFMAIGTLSWGGLSNIWGAVAPIFSEADLLDFPVDRSDLYLSYRRIAGRIGISGAADDASVLGESVYSQPALPLTGVAATVWERYIRQQNLPFLRLDRAPLVVLSQDHANRRACTLDGACLWGCSQRAVYNAAFELEEMLKHPNLTFLPGRAVTTLEKTGGRGFAVRGIERASGQSFVETAPNVVLAAGTLPSTRLALDLLRRYDEPTPLLTTPGVAAAFYHPAFLGQALPERLIGLPQLVFAEREPGGVFGMLFEAGAMSLPDLAAHLPLTRPGAMDLLRAMLPGLCLALINFPGHLSDCRVTLQNQGTLLVEGGHTEGFDDQVHRTMRNVKRDLRRLGLWHLPGSTHVYGPGALNHHVGTLACGSGTDPDGQLIGVKGLYVADGSVLSTLPARNHTLTVMANADRIGRGLARSLLAKSQPFV